MTPFVVFEYGIKLPWSTVYLKLSASIIKIAFMVLLPLFIWYPPLCTSKSVVAIPKSMISKLQRKMIQAIRRGRQHQQIGIPECNLSSALPTLQPWRLMILESSIDANSDHNWLTPAQSLRAGSIWCLRLCRLAHGLYHSRVGGPKFFFSRRNENEWARRLCLCSEGLLLSLCYLSCLLVGITRRLSIGAGKTYIW